MTTWVWFAAQMEGQPPGWTGLFPFLAIFAIFYFLLIRPQQKKQGDQKKFLEKLDKNQEVVTIGGLHGTIVQVKEKTLILRIADNVRVEIDKSAVSHAKGS